MYCADCEEIESYFFHMTTFWLFLPTEESMSKAIVLCGSNNYQSKQHNNHCIAVTVPRSDIRTFLTAIYGEFEPPELANTKITTTTGALPTIEDTARVIPANVLINRFNSSWLVDSVRQDKYTSYFQPIVRLENDTVTDFAHEALFRMRDDLGNVVPPAHVFQLAEHSDLLFSLDLVARRSAVSQFCKAKLDGKLFINFNPSSIYDPSYCLRATAAAINSVGIEPNDVVFELTETHRITNESVLKGILNFYRNAGFKVALDDIGSGWSGLNMLHKFRPDYVKIDMDLVRGIDRDGYKRTIVKHLIDIAHENGIEVIAEGIETERELVALKELKPDLLQGFYFAKPTEFESKVTAEEEKMIDDSLRNVK